ncbi:MAG: arginine--tRNA ligase [Candidatus Marsarchaeota archaeon]|nr:arginine--tRNA ligase [Candidatus Marsarchaeota archaeon]
MESPFAKAKREVSESLAKAIEKSGYRAAGLENTILIPKDSSLGDISCSIAFRLSKELKKNPKDIADNIAKQIEKPELISKVSVDNAYINFHINRPVFASLAIRYADTINSSNKLSSVGEGKKTIIEYPSANPAHPLHVGQSRSMFIGDCMANAHEACGYVVEREDYIDDLGLQAAQALWGSMHRDTLGVKQEQKKFDHALGDVYVAAAKYASEHREAEQEVRKLLELMEEEGTYESKLSRDQAEAYVMAERETTFSYNIYHDLLVWESDILRTDLLDKALAILDKHGILERPKDGKYNGCVIIGISKLKNIPKELQGLREDAKVLIRSNGTANYLAKDIAFHMWKFGLVDDPFIYSMFIEKQPNGRPLYTTNSKGSKMKFGNVEKSINVIDARQTFEQLMIKVVFDSIGESDAAVGFNHLAYGLVDLENGVLAGRKGTWIGYTADDLLREARDKALSLITDRFKIDQKKREEIAQNVAIGAIKFEVLKMSPEKVITFSWKNALNFEGNSGPYCQYMYARAYRMIEDGKFANAKSVDVQEIKTAEEFALLKQMSLIQEYAEKACKELRPNVIAEYVIDLAAAFSNFYEKAPVLKESDEKLRNFRLSVTNAFAITMKAALGLMGIGVVERM